MYRVPRAVIFDVDGVLVDSYRAHLRSWQELAAGQGCGLTEEQFMESFGQTSRDIIRRFWPPDGLTEDRIRALDEQKEALYRRIVSESFPVMEGAVELLEDLHRVGVLLAVGSSGPPENIDLVLETLGRRSLIGAVVTGMDVTRGKPDPQVFLLAAGRLGAPPEQCVVVEDAPAGIRAAGAAGMAGVALLSTGRSEEDFRDVAPALVIRSLSELTPQILGSLTPS